MSDTQSQVLVEGTTFWELVSRRADATPDRLMYADGEDRQITFGEFRTRCERVAAGLAALGIGEGTAVSWQLPTRIDTVVLSVALSRLGAIQNPIIALYREREVGSLLDQTAAEWFVIPSEWRGFSYAKMAETLRARAKQPFETWIVDDGLPEGDPATLAPPPNDPEAIRWRYSTSGTTSAPKVVLHSDRTLIAGGSGLADAIRPGPDDVGTILYPYAHIGGPDHLVLQLQRGQPSILLEAFSLPEALPVLKRNRVTITGGSTAHYLMFLEAQRAQPDTPVLPTLRLLNGGGAPMSPSTYEDAGRVLGVPIQHGYGMTECPMIANNTPDGTDDQRMHSEGPPVKGCEVRIEDQEGTVLPPGVDGHLLVRGPMVAHGYLDPEATREAFRPDGFFVTGDRGHLREDGCVVLTGRTKEMIIRKGENISPAEIEDVLMTHPSVEAVAVVGLPDAVRGERVCAVIETAEGMSPLTDAEMQRHCRDAGLMVQKIPEQLEVIDALPRNPTLKILKHELVARFRDDETTG